MDEERMTPEIPAIKLPVWATAREAYAIWFANLGLWLKLSIVPVVILIALKAVAPSVLPDAKNIDAGSVGISAAFFFVFAVIIYLSEIPLATAWHRFILTREDRASHRYLIGGREWRYFLKALLIAIIVLLVSLVLGIVMAVVMIPLMMGGAAATNVVLVTVLTSLATIGFYALLGYFLGHLFLMLPGAAVGRNISTGETRAAVRGNEWRLVGVYLVAMLPIWIVGTILTWPVNGNAVLGADDLLGQVPALIFAPVIVGVVSICYRDLVPPRQSACERTIT